MNKQTKRILLGIGCAAMTIFILLAAWWLLWNGRAQNDPAQTEPTGPGISTVPTGDPTHETQSPPIVTLPPETGTDATDPVTPPTEPPTPPTQPPTEPEIKGLDFPYAIADTELVIVQLLPYDGVFLEDGSDTDMDGVTTMLLKNTGSTGIEYADIALKSGDQTLEFTLSAVPAGACVIVQEKNGTAYAERVFTSCTANVAVLERFDMAAAAIKIEESGDYSLSVTNLTDETISCVRIFYKFYLPAENVYVGGITYTVKVVALGPGETVRITPTHYAKGFSRVMMVRLYETDA